MLGCTHSPGSRLLQYGTILREEPAPEYILLWSPIAPVSPHPWSLVNIPPHPPKGMQCCDTSWTQWCSHEPSTQAQDASYPLWNRWSRQQGGFPQDRGTQCMLSSEPESCLPRACHCPHQRLCPFLWQSCQTHSPGAPKPAQLASSSPAKLHHSLHNQLHLRPQRHSKTPLTLVTAEEIIWSQNTAPEPKPKHSSQLRL